MTGLPCSILTSVVLRLPSSGPTPNLVLERGGAFFLSASLPSNYLVSLSPTQCKTLSPAAILTDGRNSLTLWTDRLPVTKIRVLPLNLVCLKWQLNYSPFILFYTLSPSVSSSVCVCVFPPQCLHLWNRDKSNCFSASKRSTIMMHVKINEVIWLSASCWVEELWLMNTNSIWIMWAFLERELDHSTSPLQGFIKKKLGRKKLKVFLHDIPWSELWSCIRKSETLFVWYYRFCRHFSLKRAKP